MPIVSQSDRSMPYRSQMPAPVLATKATRGFAGANRLACASRLDKRQDGVIHDFILHGLILSA